ncbi:hypothetical protein [Defluviimonas salinarum]|uniref:DUF952 domain-containing protein n=1 Tax=Defluviimonas salinarum TaxID=2992147 RepID=A0ABT3J9T6_9RHOB|nr:hypothetical protein [Defluviimonas salinarum]MCW3784445.1 hypothetical protein [Defluviimonas salinarum]
MPMMFWHVTDPESAKCILDQGFLGGWGDDGFGVYLYDCRHAALRYAAKGGWDGGLDPETAVLIEVEVPEGEAIEVIPHPEWPNPEAYRQIFLHPMDEDDEGAFWTPERRLFETGPAPVSGGPA